MQSVSTPHCAHDGHVVVFVDDGGRSIKFRLQPGFNSTLRTRLEKGITSHGGLVMNKMPVRGLVVVDPKSLLGRELVREWAWEERPGRRFVPYAYVLQCLNLKRMLPLDEHALRRDDFVRTAEGTGKTQPDLSAEAKDKLALYLATSLPDPASGKRSSNILYQDLVKNKSRHPWVGNYDWKTFRNQYCKNKKFYDKLISAIVADCGQTGKPISTPRKKFLIAKNSDKTLVPSVMDVVIPAQNKAGMEAMEPRVGKKVKFNKTLLIERKRKLEDVTNVPKEKAPKRLRTVDDMLNAPLPPIVYERRGARLQGKSVKSHPSQASGAAAVEIGRAAQNGLQGGVWVDDSFKFNGSRSKENETQTDACHNTSGSQSRDRFQESLSFYAMDLDDLRSAATLDAMNNDSDTNSEDENIVTELLGLSTALSEAPTPSDPSFEKNVAETESHQKSTCLGVQQTDVPKESAVLELNQKTHFSREEIEHKLAGFAGDMEKTRKFFERCRQFIDDLFVRSLNAEAGAVIDLSRMRSKGAGRVKFPAMNITRTRKAEAGRKGDTAG